MIEIAIMRGPAGGRQFPVAFRIEFLRLWDQCLERGAKTRLLREHNLDPNTVRRWRLARERGEFTSSMVAAADETRSRVDNRDRAELAALRAENAALKKKVAQSEAAQQILGKAFELLEGITESSTDPDPTIPPALMSAEEYAQWLQRRGLS